MRLSSVLFLGLMLSGCKKDADGDGYPAGDDCDDNNDAINPGSSETCDGIDNDCDGSVDEDLASTFYADTDEDGYGDPNNEVQSCDVPEGYVSNSEDCNDTSASFYPGAPESDCTDPNDYNCDDSVGYTDADGDGFAACEDCDDSDFDTNPDADEVCDGVDNDCDTYADFQAVDATTWYIDTDDDGYGSTREDYIEVECEQPEGYVDNADDCDDSTALAAPGGTEVCDGLDNDCNGVIDGADASDAQSYYTDADGDGFGDDSTLTVTCDDLLDVVDEGGDCDDSLSAVNPDAEEICNDGLDNNCAGSGDACGMDLTDADAEFYGVASEDQAGYTVDSAGDIDGDGAGDLIVGAWQNDDGGTDAGAAYVIYGPVTSDDYQLDEVTSGGLDGFAIYGNEEGQAFGRSVAGVGDVDGDGLGDVLIGMTLDDEYLEDAGGAALFLGKNVGTATEDIDNADLYLTGGKKYDYAGGFVNRAGDVNDDGLSDFLVGAVNDDTGGSNAGTVFLVLGAATYSSSTMALADADGVYSGNETSDKAGLSFDSVFNFDGDGFDDVAVGVRLKNQDTVGSDAGYVYVMSGFSSGTIELADTDLKVYGGASSDRLGESVSWAGDVDSDGLDDLMAAAPLESTGGSSAGSVYVLLGSNTASTLYGDVDVDSVSYLQIYGDPSDSIGSSTAGGGDINGDGSPDLVVGAASAGVSTAGEAYVFYGPLTSGSYSTADADATLEGDTNSDGAGSAVRFAGDPNGMGHDGLLVGAKQDDANGTDSGAAYLILELAD